VTNDERIDCQKTPNAQRPNSANPYYMPTKEKNSPIGRDDFLLIDAATKLNKPDAVATDQTWTGYVGESVPEEYSRIFNIVREARDSAVDFVCKNIRAGKPIRGAEVDDVSRGVITRAGCGEQFTHRTGHSIGEETHGNGVNIDDFETRDSRRTIPGVCFSIEPGIYLEGKFGVRSEINVYISDKDIEVTGQPTQTEIIAILKPVRSESDCELTSLRRVLRERTLQLKPSGRFPLRLR
jgi:Xaa-Pro dipeptidase